MPAENTMDIRFYQMFPSNCSIPSVELYGTNKNYTFNFDKPVLNMENDTFTIKVKDFNCDGTIYKFKDATLPPLDEVLILVNFFLK